MFEIVFLSLAGLPRGRPNDFSVSRDFREAARTIFLARGTSAKQSEGFFCLAGLPRSRLSDFFVSRDFRKADRAVRHARGTSASVAGGGRESLCFDTIFIFASVLRYLPQVEPGVSLIPSSSSGSSKPELFTLLRPLPARIIVLCCSSTTFTVGFIYSFFIFLLFWSPFGEKFYKYIQILQLYQCSIWLDL